MYLLTITEHLINIIPFTLTGEYLMQATVEITKDIISIRKKLFGV